MPGSDNKITDYHKFEIWRRENNAVDIYCSREEFQIDPATAVLEAEVVARSLGESLQDANELFRIKIYDNGLSSTLTRDPVVGDKWDRFQWVRERAHSALYSGVIALPKPPEWFMKALWGMEFAACLGLVAWGKLRGTLEPAEQLAQFNEPHELSPESDPDPEPESSRDNVVVAFPIRRPT